jgi:pimeloyl-ACP methyl ester carboxylesterase
MTMEIRSIAQEGAPIFPVRRRRIKRRYVLALVAVAVGLGVWGAKKVAIRHDKLPLYDTVRQRSVPVDLYVRRDKSMQAAAGFGTLRVAIVNHGNTVSSSEYKFLANVLAARGYLVASIQHDLPTDPPLSMQGYPYVGRLATYERGAANIDFVLAELKKIHPNADYDNLTIAGHSQGGDISVFYAAGHPDQVDRVITLDNLRVPLEFVRAKVLSFRARGGDFKPDPGVVPDEDKSKDLDVELDAMGAHHTDLSDRGPDDVKARISAKLDKFLSDDKPRTKKPQLPPVQVTPGVPQ